MVKIRAYIGEATEYDKKETLEERRPKSWLKSVSAFANGNGGVLLFGVADDDALKGVLLTSLLLFGSSIFTPPPLYVVIIS